MKKRNKAIVIILLFFIFSFVIFSMENEQNNKDKALDEMQNIEIPSEMENEEQNTNIGKKEGEEFSSIQVSGLTIANGSKWYFEEYDENGNVMSTISYDNDKLIEEANFEYNNGKKVTATFIDPKKIAQVKYNEKGIEIERAEYKNKKGKIGKPIISNTNRYNTQGLIKEETKTINGVTLRKEYAYSGNKRITETVFENDIKILFIEYKEKTKIVHIFNEGIEIKVFEEENKEI